MSRRPRATLSPSLFPFLAVLVCTLGTLILLLALVAQQAKENRQRETAESTPEPTVDDESVLATRLTAVSAKRLIDEETFRTESLVAQRDKQTAEMESLRDQLTGVEAHSVRLREKLRQLNAEIESVMSEAEPVSLDVSALERTQEKIEALKAEIEELKANPPSERPRVVIVPHMGPNSTPRRPIYLECTSSGVTVWPEDVKISRRQLAAAAQVASPSANPLDAALRSVRLHALQNYGDAVPPYPLLIVRPDGIKSYELARANMKDWDDQFGYELIPDDMDLAMGPSDPVLKRQIELVVHEASARSLSQFVRGGAGNGRGVGEQGDSDRSGYSPGGFRETPGRTGALAGKRMSRDSFLSSGDAASGRSGPSKPLPTLSARQLDLQAQASGFSNQDSFPYGSGLGGGNAAVVPGSDGRSFSAAGGQSRVVLTGEGSSQSEALDELLRRGAEGNELQRIVEEDDKSLAESAGTLSTTDAAGRDRGQWHPAESPMLSSQAASSPRGGSSTSSVADAPSLEAGTSGSSDSASAQVAQPANASVASGQGTPMVATQPSSAGASASTATANSQPAPQTGASGEPCDDCEEDPTRQLKPSNIRSTPPVRRDGKDWALPNWMRQLRGGQVIRPISMVCYPDRFELIQFDRLGRAQVQQTLSITNGDVNDATLQLAGVLRDRVDEWGPPLPGSRWQPRLEVSVAPHAEQRFHQLQTLLRGSGIEVVERAR
ncbi:MAG: hypothetical protein AAGD07_06675 [Planctomycetota bacterium]